MYKPRKCPVCGKVFDPASPSHKYCSTKCARKVQYDSFKVESTPIFCIICGKSAIPKGRTQVTCGCEECKSRYVAIYGRAHKCKYDVPTTDQAPKKKRGMSKARWNALTPSERWKRMGLAEVNEECLKFGMEYGESQSACYNGTLPLEFGRRV